MIIKKLIVNNFRVFQGRHEINLTPEDNKPIILFGGLNGSGKTSILTAIRLALYGRMAFENITQTQSYIDHLSTLIFQNSSSENRAQETSLELTFTYNQGGSESEFTVIRSWKQGRIDKLKLLQDGQSLNELSYEQCQGFLNELIPNGIADLFFFDGEKIASLAEDESGKILQTAVRRLLGIDLIEKLRNDLIIYLKKQNVKDLGVQHQQQLEKLEQEKEFLAKKIEYHRYEAELTKINIEHYSLQIQKYENLLSAEGGAFALTKAQEQQRVDSLLKEKEVLEKSIRVELENTYPLSLAPKTLSGLLTQLNNEANTKQTISFTKGLNEFLDRLKADIAFRSSTTYKIASQAIEDQLKEYIESKPLSTVLLDISERELGMYQQLINSESLNAKERFNTAKQRLIQVEKAIDEASINIQRAPDDEQLITLFNKLRELDTKRQSLINQHKESLEQARKNLLLQLDCSRQIQRLHDKVRDQYGVNSAITHAHEAINLLNDYSILLTQARVKALETNFSRSYNRLTRKENSGLTARINTKSFDVELINNQGQAINRKSLSAGEKQIYAIAILEALGKTSGRQLPIIIDTPLGRLDSKHRDKLVEYYFPLASHQVIILSTDTEIDERYYSKYLIDDISRSYLIKFNSQTHSSILQQGYFWNNKLSGAA